MKLVTSEALLIKPREFKLQMSQDFRHGIYYTIMLIRSECRNRKSNHLINHYSIVCPLLRGLDEIVGSQKNDELLNPLKVQLVYIDVEFRLVKKRDNLQSYIN